MRRLASIFMITGFFLILPLAPVHLSAGSDDFQNLEFFLERALKNSKDSSERVEIVNRFLFKALARMFHELPSRDREDGRATW